MKSTETVADKPPVDDGRSTHTKKPNNAKEEVKMTLLTSTLEDITRLDTMIRNGNKAQTVADAIQIAMDIMGRVEKGEEILVRKKNGSLKALKFELAE